MLVLSCLVLSCPALAKELSNLPQSVMLCLGLWSVLFGLWPLENSALAPWGMVWIWGMGRLPPDTFIFHFPISSHEQGHGPTIPWDGVSPEKHDARSFSCPLLR